MLRGGGLSTSRSASDIYSSLKGNPGVASSDGDYYINGNIGDDRSSIKTIVAKNIYISGSVSHIHANLIATGKIVTCYEGYDSNTQLGMRSGSNDCGRRLVIDGSIVSGESPRFLRTFGGGNCDDQTCNSQSNDTWKSATAEKINYTPDVWLNANKYAGQSSIRSYTIDNITSLPARY